MCSSGYTGQNCENDYIPCDPSPCENGGSCHQLSEHDYECICSEGEYCANFLSYRIVESHRATYPLNPAKDETFSYINTYDLLVYFALFASNLALLCVRITSFKVTEMTAESTRLGDCHHCGLKNIAILWSITVTWKYLDFSFSLLCRSLPEHVMNNFRSLLCYRGSKSRGVRENCPEDFSHGASSPRSFVTVQYFGQQKSLPV